MALNQIENSPDIQICKFTNRIGSILILSPKVFLTLIGKLWKFFPQIRGTTQTVLWIFFSTHSPKIQFLGYESDGFVEFFFHTKIIPVQYFLILKIFGVRVRRFCGNFFQSKMILKINVEKISTKPSEPYPKMHKLR